MGWTSCGRCGETHWEFFGDAWGKDFVILECSPVGYTNICLAVKSLKTQQVFGVVVTHRWYKSRYGMEYSYRDDDESCGPDAIAPENVLLRLTPTDHEYGKKWREECWDRIKSKKKLSFRVGDELLFKNPVGFTNGNNESKLIVTSTKPLRFNHSYRISNLLNYEFTHLRNGQEVQIKPKERTMNSKEFEFQFDLAQVDWSKLNNSPLEFLKERGAVIREIEHTFGRNYFVYKLKNSDEYSVVTRTRNTTWLNHRPTTLYKHTIITPEGFTLLKKMYVASKLSA